MPLIVLLIAIFIIVKTIESVGANKRKQSKIALQNYVSTPHSNLVLTDRQLAKAANSYLFKCKKSLEKCLESMQKASTPKVFFPKLMDYYDIKEDISGLKNVWIGNFSVRFPTESDINNLTNEMIDRYWRSCKEKSINSVSDKAKKHAFQSFFDTLDLYKKYMSSNTIRHIDDYRSDFNKMFISNTIEISR